MEYFWLTLIVNWFAQTFDECVEKKQPDCDPKNMWLQIPFFCGHAAECWTPGSQWALKQAKRNLVENYFLVGLTEEMEDFIYLLDLSLPRFEILHFPNKKMFLICLFHFQDFQRHTRLLHEFQQIASPANRLQNPAVGQNDSRHQKLGRLAHGKRAVPVCRPAIPLSLQVTRRCPPAGTRSVAKVFLRKNPTEISI